MWPSCPQACQLRICAIEAISQLLGQIHTLTISDFVVSIDKSCYIAIFIFDSNEKVHFEQSYQISDGQYSIVVQ